MQTIKELGKYTFECLLKNSVKLFKNRPAVSFAHEKPITYGEFYDRVREVQKLLVNVGLKAGDHIAILSPSSPFWGIAYFAIVLMGCVAVPLLHDFTESEVASCIVHSGAKTIFVASKMLDKLKNVETLNVVIGLEDFNIIKGEKIEDKNDENESVHHECKEEDIASIIYTSGTTGRSKAVMLTHKNLVFTAIAGQQTQRINKYDRAVSILPLSHVYEFTIGFLMFILNGACIYYLGGPPVPRVLLPCLSKVKPQFMLVVPIVIEKIYKQKVLPTLNNSKLLKFLYSHKLTRKFVLRKVGKRLVKTFGGRLKFFGIGGAKIDPIVEQFMKDARFPYAIGYGLTETSPLVVSSPKNKTRVGYLGKQVRGIEVRLEGVDEETGVGELVVRGDNVMRGYYNDDKMTAEAFTHDGFFKTGDLCKIDKKGWITLMGRSKNMILGPSGENIYPEDIEFVINQHPLVSESLVIEGENQALVAYVKLDEEKLVEAMKDEKGDGFTEKISHTFSGLSESIVYKKEELLNEIKYFINSNVNRMNRVDSIQEVGEFEKTASQKIKRYLYQKGSKKEEDKA